MSTHLAFNCLVFSMHNVHANKWSQKKEKTELCLEFWNTWPQTLIWITVSIFKSKTSKEWGLNPCRWVFLLHLWLDSAPWVMDCLTLLSFPLAPNPNHWVWVDYGMVNCAPYCDGGVPSGVVHILNRVSGCVTYFTSYYFWNSVLLNFKWQCLKIRMNILQTWFVFSFKMYKNQFQTALFLCKECVVFCKLTLLMTSAHPGVTVFQ